MKFRLNLVACISALMLWFVGRGPLAVRAAEEITTLNQLNRLGPTAEPKPLRLRGVVVCYDAGWHQLYLHDGEHTSYFNADDFRLQPEVGHEVEITGLVRASNVFAGLALEVLGRKQLPRAIPLKVQELAREHSEWIETTGRVLSTEASRGRLSFVMQDQGQNCLVFVLGGPVTNYFKGFLGCQVRVRGINASKSTGDRLEAGMIFVPGTNQISMLDQSLGLPEVPVISIGSLLSRELGPWTNAWVHVNGLLVSYQAGQWLTVKDPTGVIRAQIVQMTETGADERIDVWGFLSPGQDEPVLKNAWFEVVRPPARGVFATTAAGGTNLDAAKLSNPLSRISEVVKLSREEAGVGIPVHLRGIVTYADPDWQNAFLQDNSGAIFVYLNPNQNNVQSGQWVEITGRTSSGGFAPEVLSSELQVLGTTNLPAAVPVDVNDLANGHLDAHWVEMEGIVQRIDQKGGHLILSVMSENGRFKAIIPAFENKHLPGELLDAQVKVQGACTSESNARNQITGIVLQTPGLHQIRIVQAPPADPFEIPTTRLDAVATFKPDQPATRRFHRLKVKGTVTLRLPGQGFILQDASGGMRVLTRQTDEVNPGDVVEVLAFPSIGDFSPFLEEAVFRRVGTAALPMSVKTRAEQMVLNGTNDSQLVEMTGRLLQTVPRSAAPQLVLQDGPIIFTAQFASQVSGDQFPVLQSGSLLRLRGVGVVQGAKHDPETFRLYLRQPEDIEVLETPPWWTARYTFMLAGSLAVGIAAALAWVGLLRRQVRTQTRLIRQKLEDEAALEERYQDLFENANDMLYTHDLRGVLTSINQTGEHLLQRSRMALLNRNLVEFVAEEQQPAARQWLETVLKGTAPATTEWDFQASSNQRVKLEISTRLIEQSGRLLEVEGIARDITERKRLEREILEISNREQRRIGHDLHDGVCQQLAGISLMTSSLADELEENGVPQALEASKISDLLGEVIEQTRGVARGLFPVRLEQHGLVCALEELAVNAGELFKMNCRFTAENPPATVENDIALHLYYIVLEAVANASKHGKAQNVQITLKPAGDRYELSIRDDGVGFAPGITPQTGMGLRILHYRARVIGATLSLQSRPGSGSDIRCLFLPVLHEMPPETNNGTPVTVLARERS